MGRGFQGEMGTQRSMSMTHGWVRVEGEPIQQSNSGSVLRIRMMELVMSVLTRESPSLRCV